MKCDDVPASHLALSLVLREYFMEERSSRLVITRAQPSGKDA